MTRKLAYAALVVFYLAAPAGAGDVFEAKRKQMVQRHIKARGITDKAVLDAMGKVKRENFVHSFYKKHAYSDNPLPIGQGQTISQPFIVALMTQAIGPKPTDRVLEIGTGSGYQAAVLAEIVKEVYTIEILPALAKQAKARLKRLGYKNVYVKAGDGFFGWPKKAPFDAIVLTAATEKIPEPLMEQLKPGGRMIFPYGPTDSLQYLTLVTKTEDGKAELKVLEGVRFVPMTGEVRK